MVVVTPTEIDVEWPDESLIVTVAVPPPTAVSVNDPLLVALAPETSRRAADDEDAAATVTTAVSDDVAVNVPLYPASLTVIVVLAPAPERLTEDVDEPLVIVKLPPVLETGE